MKIYKYFAFIFVLFFTFDTLYAQLVSVRPRPKPRPSEVKTEKSKSPTDRVPQYPTNIARPQNLDFLPNQNSQRPILEIPNLTLERLEISEGGIRQAELPLNREQRRQFRRAILSLARYVDQNTTRLNNKQAELVEKLTEAVLLNPTHNFIRQAIRMLEAGQITSPEQVSGIITVLGEAKSFMRRTNNHTNSLNRALFRNGYSRQQNRGWCI